MGTSMATSIKSINQLPTRHEPFASRCCEKSVVCRPYRNCNQQSTSFMVPPGREAHLQRGRHGIDCISPRCLDAELARSLLGAVGTRPSSGGGEPRLAVQRYSACEGIGTSAGPAM
mmetsp:Transcript_42660/g.106163  ORF Transcript_42660/g.106163 Transcript_42660/m.106163 type:complete len:116 (+) Transcript_42660:191-538(+)